MIRETFKSSAVYVRIIESNLPKILGENPNSSLKGDQDQSKLRPGVCFN